MAARLASNPRRQDKPVMTLRTCVTRGDGTVLLEGTAVCYTMALTRAEDP